MTRLYHWGRVDQIAYSEWRSDWRVSFLQLYVLRRYLLFHIISFKNCQNPCLLSFGFPLDSSYFIPGSFGYSRAKRARGPAGRMGGVWREVVHVLTWSDQNCDWWIPKDPITSWDKVSTLQNRPSLHLLSRSLDSSKGCFLDLVDVQGVEEDVVDLVSGYRGKLSARLFRRLQLGAALLKWNTQKKYTEAPV